MDSHKYDYSGVLFGNYGVITVTLLLLSFAT